MKKLSIALFAVLFLAIAFLYFLHFTGKKDKKSVKNNALSEIQSEGIAFVNIDTVI